MHRFWGVPEAVSTGPSRVVSLLHNKTTFSTVRVLSVVNVMIYIHPWWKSNFSNVFVVDFRVANLQQIVCGPPKNGWWQVRQGLQFLFRLKTSSSIVSKYLNRKRSQPFLQEAVSPLFCVSFWCLLGVLLFFTNEMSNKTPQRPPVVKRNRKKPKKLWHSNEPFFSKKRQVSMSLT